MLEEKQSCSSRKPAFFPIPNFTPLLSSYNIPAPVIVPPGADPYPFLNPNLHCDEFLEKLSPMDVDPCVVASRSETVARTIELTAAEQAGVPLSEPTMMSITSESPANSVVGAPQTVTTIVSNLVRAEYESGPQTLTDKIEVKDDRKKDNLIVCDINCNSEKVFRIHKEGRTHIKNTLKQETSSPVVDETLDPELEKKNQDLVSSPIKQGTQSLVANDTIDQESEEKNQNLVSSPIKQETQSRVANDTLDQESEEKNQNLLRNEASVDPLFVCSIPEPGGDYQKIATVECGYIPPLVTGSSCKPTAVSTAVVQRSNGAKLDIQQASSDTMPVKSPFENLKPTDIETGDSDDQKTWCDLCRICCSSLINFNQHIKGKKHQKNLKKTEKHIVESPAVVAKSGSQDPMNKKEVVVLDGSKRKDDDSLTSDEHAHPKRQKIMMKEECAITCKACNVICNGLEAFKTHLAGSKHSLVVMKESVVGSSK